MLPRDPRDRTVVTLQKSTSASRPRATVLLCSFHAVHIYVLPRESGAHAKRRSRLDSHNTRSKKINCPAKNPYATVDPACLHLHWV